MSSTPPASAPASLSITDLVRKAISAGHSTPTAGVAYIKKQFNKDLTPQQFSNAKSGSKKDAGKPASPAKKPAPAAKPAAKPAAPPAKPVPVNSNATPAALAVAVRALVKTYGATAVKDMADVFGG